jgi:hypothetical protein
LLCQDLEVVVFGKKPSTWTAEESLQILKEFPDLDNVAKRALESRSVTIKGKSISALDWLIEVSFRPHVARFLPTFRVDHPLVLKMVGRDPEKTKFASWNDVLKNIEIVTKSATRSKELPQSQREAEDRALIQLENAARQYAALTMTFIPGDLPVEIAPRQEYQTWLSSLNRAAAQISKNPAQDGMAPKLDKELQDNLKYLIDRYQNFVREGTIRIVPPLKDDGTGEWDNLGVALLSVITDRHLHRPALAQGGTLYLYAEFCDGWRQGKDGQCAESIRSLKSSQFGSWTQRADAETTFSRLQPFYWLLIAYFILILYTLWIWAKGAKDKYYRIGYFVLIALFVAHTLALGFRMWLHERPPVTNLYSSGIFVSLGCSFTRSDFRKNLEKWDWNCRSWDERIYVSHRRP